MWSCHPRIHHLPRIHHGWKTPRIALKTCVSIVSTISIYFRMREHTLYSSATYTKVAHGSNLMLKLAFQSTPLLIVTPAFIYKIVAVFSFVSIMFRTRRIGIRIWLLVNF